MDVFNHLAIASSMSSHVNVEVIRHLKQCCKIITKAVRWEIAEAVVVAWDQYLAISKQ